jgi:alkaline phosphatase D
LRRVTPDPDLHRDLLLRVTMHRRRFLGLAAAGAGSLALAACSGSDGDDAAAPRTTDTEDSTATSTTVPDAQGITADPFTLGVASGDPLPGSVILWTRLAPEPFDPSGAGGLSGDDVAVAWEVATDEAFEDVVASGTEVAGAEFGHSIHVDADGLDADSWYWYRFRLGEFTSPVGRTRTTPADDATVEELTFAFASCQLRTAGHWTAYDHVVDDDPDLVVFLGDYIYEYPGGTGALSVPLEAEPADLADYRVLHAAYKVDAKLQAAHAVAPWVVTWDDHEVENNHAADVPEDPADAATFDARRRAAYQAYWEHLPLRLDPPADGALELYRAIRWGSLATFFVLDGRQYRTDQVCGDNLATSASSCPELDDEDHTMLGAEQESWLTDGLAAADTTWKVLAQQTVMKALVLGDVVLNVDQWDGYPAARRRLLQSIADDGVENVVVLTGDIHAGGAADIRLPDATTTGAVVAHELVGTSISSPGLGADLAGAIDLGSLGLAYANFADNGYVRCTVTPERWRADFLVVDTIEEPTSAVAVDASVEVQAGKAGLRRL